MVTTSARRQRENIAPQQVMIQETTTDPVDQGHIAAPTKQPVSKSRECHGDSSKYVNAVNDVHTCSSCTQLGEQWL